MVGPLGFRPDGDRFAKMLFRRRVLAVCVFRNRQIVDGYGSARTSVAGNAPPHLEHVFQNGVRLFEPAFAVEYGAQVVLSFQRVRMVGAFEFYVQRERIAHHGFRVGEIAFAAEHQRVVV